MGVSVWLRHTNSCTHTHTHYVHTIVGVFPLEGKVSLPLTHSSSLLPFIPPFRRHTPPHLLPLDLSLSFIPHSFLCESSHPSSPLSKEEKKNESVEDTVRVGQQQRETMRGRPKSPQGTIMAWAVFACVFVRSSFSGLIVGRDLRRVLLRPPHQFILLFSPLSVLPSVCADHPVN